MDKNHLRTKVERIKDKLANPPDDYIDGWLEESTVWQVMGLYRKAAEIVDPKKGGVHVDLGSGLAHLIEQIKLKRPDSAVIGVEYRAQMIRRATQRLIENIVPVTSFETAELQVNDDLQIETDYTFGQEYLPEIKTQDYGSPIILINDDIRTRAVLLAALEGKHIDSGSLSFPGGTELLQLQTPYIPVCSSSEEMDHRFKEVNLMVRAEAIDFFSEKIKPGGHMVIMDRFRVINNMDQMDLLAFLKSQLMNNSKYWNNEIEVHILERPILHHGGGISWGRDRSTSSDTTPTSVYIAKFTRNNVVFKK